MGYNLTNTNKLFVLFFVKVLWYSVMYTSQKSCSINLPVMTKITWVQNTLAAGLQVLKPCILVVSCISPINTSGQSLSCFAWVPHVVVIILWSRKRLLLLCTFHSIAPNYPFILLYLVNGRNNQFKIFWNIRIYSKKSMKI